MSAIETFDGERDEASGPMSSTLRLREDVDVSRGDLVCRANNQPAVVCELDAMVCRMSQQPLVAGRRFGVKHTTRTVKAVASEIVYRVDVNRLHREESATEPRLNYIGRVRLRLAAPLAVDAYRRNQSTGSFILIDGATTETSGAAMVLQPTGAQVVVEGSQSTNVVWSPSTLTRAQRWESLGQSGATLWLTGLPASGKSRSRPRSNAVS